MESTEKKKVVRSVSIGLINLLADVPCVAVPAQLVVLARKREKGGGARLRAGLLDVFGATNVERSATGRNLERAPTRRWCLSKPTRRLTRRGCCGWFRASRVAASRHCDLRVAVAVAVVVEVKVKVKVK